MERVKLTQWLYHHNLLTNRPLHTPSHTNVCNFFKFSTYIFSADITPEMLKLGRVTKVKVFYLVLGHVFTIDLFEFSVAIHTPRDDSERSVTPIFLFDGSLSLPVLYV